MICGCNPFGSRSKLFGDDPYQSFTFRATIRNSFSTKLIEKHFSPIKRKQKSEKCFFDKKEKKESWDFYITFR